MFAVKQSIIKTLLRKIKFTNFCIAFSIVIFQLPLALYAQVKEGVNSERLAAEINAEIMSPYCPGRTISACPSSKATDLRDEVLNKAESGFSKAEVISWLESKYGDVIYPAPKSGFNYYLAWFIPFIFLFLGFAIALFKLYPRNKNLKASKNKAILPSDETLSTQKLYEEKLEKMLNERMTK